MLNSKQIRFDLLTNATDSLRQAVELMAWKEVGHEHAPLKHAISHAAHAFELLLKERLRRTNAALSWENVDIRALKHALSRWKETISICIQTAISRLKKIADVHISDDDAKQIKSLRTTRNAIEHYEWETTEREARVIVGNALSFAFSFAQDHLGADLSATFRSHDTWPVLVDDLHEFAEMHGRRIEARLETQGTPTTYCDKCETATVPVFGGSCELCDTGKTQLTSHKPLETDLRTRSRRSRTSPASLCVRFRNLSAVDSIPV